MCLIGSFLPISGEKPIKIAEMDFVSKPISAYMNIYTCTLYTPGPNSYKVAW